MEISTDDVSNSRGRRMRNLLLGGGAVGLIAILGLAWWLGFLTPEPEPVSITEAAAAVVTESGTDADTGSDTDADEGATTADASADASDTEDAPAEVTDVLITSIVGEWTVVESEATFIGYRADSQVGEAVGRSPGVVGTLTATEDEVTAVNIVGDMTLLESDSSVRDDHLGDEGLETNVFPTSTFVLTEPIAISSIPAAGVEETFTAVGELTVKDVTLPITIDLQAVIVEDKFVVAGNSTIDLEDFGAIISNTTEAVMEFSLVFTR